MIESYTLIYLVTERRSVTIDCESESAARQAWIDEAADLDANQSTLIETVDLKLEEVL